MNKYFNKLFSITIVAFALAILPQVVQAQALTINFENSPLFAEANFLPGDEVTRWVQVQNNSGAGQVMGVKMDPYQDPDNLGSELSIVIKEGAGELYNGTLDSLSNDSPVELTTIGDGENTQYDFTITFPTAAGNDYQGATLNFDLIVGILGQEECEGDCGGTIVTSSFGGGGGSQTGPDIDIQKSGSASTPAGVTNEFILTVTNLGNSLAPDVVVSDILPLGFTFVNSSLPSSVSTNQGIETITWDLGDLTPQASVIITYSIAVPDEAGGQYINQAAVVADGRFEQAGYFDQDDFSFTVAQVLGFQSEGSNGAGVKLPPDPPQDVKVLGYTTGSGYDLLPVTGGDVLGYFGIGEKSTTMTPADNQRVLTFLFVIFAYLGLGIIYLIYRQRRKHLN